MTTPREDEHDQDAEPTMTAPPGDRPDGLPDGASTGGRDDDADVVDADGADADGADADGVDTDDAQDPGA
ncbi:hypothetical protein I4I84_06625 [Pseudonocardia sp. KRD-182]|uniref:hypothetical protein n=1 Tax=Pseudonocardia oceani TaxID=2792013 RepID=UPI001C49D832|nr:hypothetical protein [Pseudonocardia oceani]MBW0108410.1 hypothetical protein [Pseudonocardia oceani]